MKKSYFFRIFGLVVMIQLMLMGTNTFAQNKYALDFAGSDYIYLNDESNHLDVSTNWTFECWINVDAQTGLDHIMYRTSVFNFSINTKNTGTGDFRVYFWNRDNDNNIGTGDNENLSFDTWYHVAATFDGTTARFYVDGTEVDNSTATWSLVSSTARVYIAEVSGGGNYFNGQIDEIRMSNIARATSAMQLSTHEEEYISDVNTIFLMHFDDDQAATPTYITGVGYSGSVGDNIVSDDYKFGEIASAKLLRPSYRSKASGNWNAPASWQYDNTGAANWVDAALTPSFYDDAITILNTITVTENVDIDQTTIASGGQVTVSTGNKLTIDNGTGTDLTIDGVLRKEGTGSISYSGTLAFNSGGKFELAGTNKYIPVATWDANSTCEITGAIGGDMTSTYHTDQEFGNFTWNCTGQTSDVYFSGALTNIDGDFILINTGTAKAIYEFRLTGTVGDDPTVDIAGDVDIQGGILNLTSGDNNCYFVCNGDYSQSAGTTIKADGSGTGYLRFGPLSGSGYSGDFTNAGTFTPEDIQVNTSYALTLASNMNIGTAPLTVEGTFVIPTSYTLTIPAGSEATATGTLTNNAGNAGLVIESTTTGTGSLITSTANVNATVQRYMTKYTTDGNGWHFLSAPVSNFTISGSNFAPVSGHDDLYKYDETVSTKNWLNYIEGSFGDTEFEVGKGYLTAFETAATKSFSGVINTGTVAKSLSYTDPSFRPGLNLLGNPYTSAIDWDLLTKTGSVDASVYVIQATDGEYISWNGTAGDLTDGIIPAMQGYFVKATATGQTVTMETADQVHDATNFYKSRKSLAEGTIKVSLGYNDYVSNTYIQIRDDATTIFDNACDAYKLFGFSQNPQIFTNDGNTVYSINCLPPNMDNYSLPLDAKIQETGEYQLTFSDIENLSNLYNIELEDLLTSTTVDVTSELVYTFTFTEGDSQSRFILHFKSTTGLDENQTSPQNTVSIYSSNNNIVVNALKGNTLSGELFVSNIVGQVVYNQELNNSNQQVINTNLNTGIYIVSVKLDNGYVISKKVIIK